MQTERDVAIDPRVSVLVQAPAGSGKTTLLTQRFLRLLRGVSGPERILALTFTRKAAQEMRARVLAALRAGAEAECPAHIDARTWEFARDARRWLDSQAIDVVNNPSRLRIETIDGFYAWLAAQLPVTAGAGGRFVIAADAGRLYAEAAQRALASEDDPAFAAAIDHALELNDERWAKLHELIARMLPSRESWLPVLAGHLRATADFDAEDERQIRATLDADLRTLIERSLQRALDAIGQERVSVLGDLLVGAAARLELGGSTLASWRARTGPLQAVAADVPRWRDLAWVLLTEKDTVRKTINKQQGFGPDCDAGSKSRIKDLLEEVSRLDSVVFAFAAVKMLPDPNYDDAHWERVKAIARVLVLAAAELDQVFRAAGECDFTAVAMAAMRALGTPDSPTDLGLALDFRIDHVLVDEFQDTSNAQLELFKLLTAGWQPGDGRTFFCVGDPMQSIYGFREAEVRAFLELAHDGLGGLPLRPTRLTSNFRAQPPLVAWVNDTFSRLFPRRDDRERGAIAYTPAEARARASVRADARVTTQLFADAADEAASIATGIEARLARNPGWRVAILVRTRRLAVAIAAALRARAMPFRAAEIGRLQDQGVVSDIILLARALSHAADRTAWFGVLRSPAVGMELSDLWQLARGAPTLRQALADPAVRSTLSAAGARRALRVHDTLEAVFALRDQSGFARWVERCWIALGSAAAGLTELDLVNARAAFDRLHELDVRELPDPSRVEQAFLQLYAPDAGDQPIEIMTIHKAKGLEFDLVVVPRLESSGRSSGSDLLQQTRFSQAGRTGIVLAARAATGEEADPLFEFLRWSDKDSARLEAERLLYVACTRAKHELWLTAVAEVRPNARSAEFSPVAGSLLRVLWPIRREDFVFTEVASEAPPGTAAVSALSRLAADWTQVCLDPGAALDAGLITPRTQNQQTPPFDWASETARQIGILVHEQLQSLRLSDNMAGAILARTDCFERWFETRGVPRPQIKGAARRVVESLLAIGEDERGRWILRQDYAADARELALSSVVDGKIIRVVLDRTFIDQGLRWVIDYKTSEHGGGDVKAFLDNEVERYAAPMQRYARIVAQLGPEPVRLGLYFPLMRAWREWAAG